MTTTNIPLRTIGYDDLKVILADHRLWIGSDGTQGKRADLSGADLSCATLTGVNLTLTGVNLDNANLSNAILCGADLRGASLIRANLYCADLSGADLRDADLHCADLYGADLFGADLRGAILYDADFSDTNLSDASLYDANLSGVRVSEPWKIVDGKLVATSDNVPSPVPADNASTDQSLSFSTKYKATAKLVDVLSGLSDKDRADIMAVLNEKFGAKST